MKICLINPPIEDFYITAIRRQPLGLLYIFAALGKAGFDVTMLNCHSPKKQVMSHPVEFNYLKRYQQRDTYPFPFKYFYHFGLSWPEIENRIKAIAADVFCISSLFTPYHRETEKIIELVTRHVPWAKIIVGGYHAALHYHYFLAQDLVDFVITGEGEEGLVQLLRSLQNEEDCQSVGNLAYRSDGAIMKTPASYGVIDNFPLPARKVLLDRDFKMYKKKMASLVASRGCPNRCAFCTSQALWGNSYRVRSIDSIIMEIDACVKEHAVHIINFEDDNLFAIKSHSVELLQSLIQYNQQHNGLLEFTAMNGVSLEQVDEEIVMLMRTAGFHELNISLVSHSASVQTRFVRPFDSKKFLDIAGFARKNNMHVRAYFILGLPGQTKEEIEDTITFLKGLGVKIFPSVFYNVFAPQEEWFMQRSSAFFNETEFLTRDDLLRYFHESMA